MKIVALGVNSKTGKCCIIKSKASYDMLKENYDLYKVQYDATNWCGCDDVERTLGLRNINLLIRALIIKKQLEEQIMIMVMIIHGLLNLT